MTELTTESIKQFFEQAAKANTDAWTSQASYFESLVKRNSRRTCRPPGKEHQVMGIVA